VTPAKTPPGYVTIEGPIGVGKTTLARRLAQTFGYPTLLEAPDENPFLPHFYDSDRREGALATQLFFLFQRARQLGELQQHDLFAQNRVADFLLEKDPLFARITLSREEYRLYEQVYDRLDLRAPTPDLVIYLQAPTDVLLDRIRQRGVASERRIQRDYLEQLNEVYSEFFLYYDSAPLLIVNASEINLASNDTDFHRLVDYLCDIKRGRHYFNPTFFG